MIYQLFIYIVMRLYLGRMWYYVVDLLGMRGVLVDLGNFGSWNVKSDRVKRGLSFVFLAGFVIYISCTVASSLQAGFMANA